MQYCKDQSQSKTMTACFDSVLNDAYRFNEFKKFAVKDFSIENALFYDRCIKIDRRNIRNPKTLEQEQRQVIAYFLLPGATLQVNLSDGCLSQILQRVDKGDFGPDLFDRAKKEVWTLMYHDTFPRYLACQEDNTLV
jgi:hypothetical protein